MTTQTAERYSLSKRQAEVANLIAAGKLTREIAEMLHLSPRTVEHHVEAIFNKFGVRSRVELAVALLGQDANPRADATAAPITNLPAERSRLIGRGTTRGWANCRGPLDAAIMLPSLRANSPISNFAGSGVQRASELLSEQALLAGNDEPYLPSILVSLGQVLAVRAAIAAAFDSAVEALILLARRDPGHVQFAVAIELAAYISAKLGDLDRSARLAGYADATFARVGFSRDYMDLAIHQSLMTCLRENLASDE